MTFGPGTVLIFGIILVPVYVVLAAWFAGDPRDTKTALMGVGYLAGLTVALWMGMFVKTMLISLVFF